MRPGGAGITMFDIGWQEFLLIAVVAVVVVGPKDLPRVIRTVGQWIRKARSLASEFQGSLEEMAREAELDEVRKQIQQVSKDGIGASIERHVDPTGELRQTIEDAKATAGAEVIEGELDETRRQVRALADAATGSTDGSTEGGTEGPAAPEVQASGPAVAVEAPAGPEPADRREGGA